MFQIVGSLPLSKPDPHRHFTLVVPPLPPQGGACQNVWMTPLTNGVNMGQGQPPGQWGTHNNYTIAMSSPPPPLLIGKSDGRVRDGVSDSARGAWRGLKQLAVCPVRANE